MGDAFLSTGLPRIPWGGTPATVRVLLGLLHEKRSVTIYFQCLNGSKNIPQKPLHWRCFFLFFIFLADTCRDNTLLFGRCSRACAKANEGASDEGGKLKTNIRRWLAHAHEAAVQHARTGKHRSPRPEERGTHHLISTKSQPNRPLIPETHTHKHTPAHTLAPIV